MRPDQWHDRLKTGDEEGEDEGEMAKFGNHTANIDRRAWRANPKSLIRMTTLSRGPVSGANALPLGQGGIVPGDNAGKRQRCIRAGVGNARTVGAQVAQRGDVVDHLGRP